MLSPLLGESCPFAAVIPSKMLHNPAWNVAQAFATATRVAHQRVSAVDPATRGWVDGTLAAGSGLIEQFPPTHVAETAAALIDPKQQAYAAGTMARGMLVPQLSQQIAKGTDHDAQGQPIARKPQGILQNLEVGIPGLRQGVPLDSKKIAAQTKADLVEGLKNDPVAGSDLLQEALHAGKIDNKTYHAIQKESGVDETTLAIHHHNIADVMAGFSHMTPDDQSKYGRDIRQKIDHASGQSLTRTQADLYRDVLEGKLSWDDAKKKLAP